MSEETFKVIIAGGRNFNDYELLRSSMDKLLSSKVADNIIIEIVSGCNKTIDKNTGEIYGADYLGTCYAAERGYIVKEFPANWKQWGLPAGPLRNKQMAKYADACVCFWDGKSKGTSWMIKFAEKENLRLRIIRYKPVVKMTKFLNYPKELKTI